MQCGPPRTELPGSERRHSSGRVRTSGYRPPRPWHSPACTGLSRQFADAARRLRAGFAWEEAGLLTARMGKTADATRSLRAAIDCYDQLGATADLSRIRTRAHRLGVRAARPSVRRAPATGWAALTPTETTVASFVRQGLTNPQIAAQLFLSPRTVQTRVSHILQKTQLRSRLEIATAQR